MTNPLLTLFSIPLAIALTLPIASPSSNNKPSYHAPLGTPSHPQQTNPGTFTFIP
jgi:hypothetical protein